MTVNDPFSRLPDVPAFTVTSNTIADGDVWSTPQLSARLGGQDRSPHLLWSGAPEGTKSFAVTVYDPDAPTMSGYWHWLVADIPASVTELPEGAGVENSSDLPIGAYQLRNDRGTARYIGAAPPAGHGPHRYFVVVHALDVENIGVGPEATAASLGFTISSHILGRAVLVATAEVPGV